MHPFEIRNFGFHLAFLNYSSGWSPRSRECRHVSWLNYKVVTGRNIFKLGVYLGWPEITVVECVIERVCFGVCIVLTFLQILICNASAHDFAFHSKD